MEGNQMKMREALENIVGYAETARCHTEDAHVLGYLEQIEKWANEALSAPARNCDAFPDEYDARKEWSRIGKCSECKEEILYCERCYGRWLLAPAAEREGDGDGR